MLAKILLLKKDIVLRYRCLEECWQRGYTWDYRWFRFREAFGLLKDGE